MSVREVTASDAEWLLKFTNCLREMGWLSPDEARALRERAERAEGALAEAKEALALCRKVIPCLTVRNWPPGFELKAAAIRAADSAIARAALPSPAANPPTSSESSDTHHPPGETDR